MYVGTVWISPREAGFCHDYKSHRMRPRGTGDVGVTAEIAYPPFYCSIFPIRVLYTVCLGKGGGCLELPF